MGGDGEIGGLFTHLLAYSSRGGLYTCIFSPSLPLTSPSDSSYVTFFFFKVLSSIEI